MARNEKRWEAFEYQGMWWIISPSRGTSDGPFSETVARERVARLNREADVRAAFIAQEQQK